MIADILNLCLNASTYFHVMFYEFFLIRLLLHLKIVFHAREFGVSKKIRVAIFLRYDAATDVHFCVITIVDKPKCLAKNARFTNSDVVFCTVFELAQSSSIIKKFVPL